MKIDSGRVRFSEGCGLHRCRHETFQKFKDLLYLQREIQRWWWWQSERPLSFHRKVSWSSSQQIATSISRNQNSSSDLSQLVWIWFLSFHEESRQNWRKYMKCIPNVEEKYISLSKDIVDTFINKEGKVVKVLTFSNLSLDKLRETEKIFKV